MKRITIGALTLLMGLAAFAPLAANADERCRDYEVLPIRREVRVEYRRKDEDRRIWDKREHDRIERLRFERERHDHR